MSNAKQTLTVSLDERARRRLEKAAGLLNLSTSDFVTEAADERARVVLLNWAVAAYRAGDHTFSQLAAESGLAVEEIMMAMSRDGNVTVLDNFLDRCRTLAETYDNPEFLRLAEQAVARVRAEEHSDAALQRAVEQVMAELRRRA
ncbi:MAG: DUF1778 domain-containing protein [Dehalococcoidia bacterium]